MGLKRLKFLIKHQRNDGNMIMMDMFCGLISDEVKKKIKAELER